MKVLFIILILLFGSSKIFISFLKITENQMQDIYSNSLFFPVINIKFAKI